MDDFIFQFNKLFENLKQALMEGTKLQQLNIGEEVLSEKTLSKFNGMF